MTDNNEISINSLLTDLEHPLDHQFDSIMEIKLINFNICRTVKSAWGLLRRLYKKILHADPFWHFFYEGSFTVIRFSEKNSEQVLKFLKKNRVEFTNPLQWKDNQEITAKYQRIFTYIFHGFSVLAMESKKSDIRDIADRNIHCYLDMEWYKLENYRKQYPAVFWEGNILTELALSRVAYNAGHFGSTAPEEI